MVKYFTVISSILALLSVSTSGWAESKGRRCATAKPTAMELAESHRLAHAPDTLVFPGTGIVIPIAFHVIQNQKAVGNISDEDIQQQIQVLNNAYIGTGFQFSLQTTDRTINNIWFTGCMTGAERNMKSQLAIDPAHILNVYTCYPSTDDLGYAYFPRQFPEANIMHGVVIGYGTLPNGIETDYNLGFTLVHETGHYLGLYHTFDEGYRLNGCLGGDGVDDTASEKSEAYGCPLTRDSCPNQIGRDPVTNYMDYSDDACMTEISLGQIRLMRQSVAKWRPGLLTPLN